MNPYGGAFWGPLAEPQGTRKKNLAIMKTVVHTSRTTKYHPGKHLKRFRTFVLSFVKRKGEIWVRGHDRCLLLCRGRGYQNPLKTIKNHKKPSKRVKIHQKQYKNQETQKYVKLYGTMGVARLQQGRNIRKVVQQ